MHPLNKELIWCGLKYPLLADNQTLCRIEPILFLHTVDKDGKKKKFAVDGEDRPIVLSGPGIMLNCVCGG